MLAEFKGTYRAPHPGGIKDQNVLKDFHVKVEMPKSFLKAPGLNGFFVNHYLNYLRSAYPDLIKTYRFQLIEVTELDGSVIDNPKCLSYQGLLDYIKRREFPINPSLFDEAELRNEVLLYEQDAKGQQFLQDKIQQRKGTELAIAQALSDRPNLVRVIQPQAAKSFAEALG